jgi:prepilin-type N-terminal cleavage/methylation domain-containing protein
MQRGFSLVEVVVAMAVMSTATMAIAQLAIVSVRVNRIARSTTVATVLAVQKMEQLQAAAWAELAASPSEVLDWNTDGYCDFLDANARTLAAGTSPPGGAVFVRRWALSPIAAADALVIQVTVTPIHGAGGAVIGRSPGEARFVGIKIRR